MDVSTEVRRKQTRLGATAMNNLGVATNVAGVVAPPASYLFGTLQIDHPLRLPSVMGMYGWSVGLSFYVPATS